MTSPTSLPVKLPLMTVRCDACGVAPTLDIPVRAIYPPGTIFPEKSKEEIRKEEEERKKQKETLGPSVRLVGNLFIVYPLEDITDSSLRRYKSKFKVAPRVECLICYAKRFLLAALTPNSGVLPVNVYDGIRVIEVLQTWPQFAKEVENILPTEVYTNRPAGSELREWARSFVRITAEAQREAWINELRLQQPPSENIWGSLRSFMSRKEYKKAGHLLWAAHEESMDLLKTRGAISTPEPEPIKRSRGRPSRPALKAALAFLVEVKMRELETRKQPVSQLRALRDIVPIIKSACQDILSDVRNEPHAVASRLRKYL